MSSPPPPSPSNVQSSSLSPETNPNQYSQSQSTIFPTTLSDLSYKTNSQPTIYKTLSLLSKRTLSLHNRLLSIDSDSQFIRHLATTVFPSYPVIANERCGSWYVPPDLKRGSAYFKSTDGHVGQWQFSLRRLNLGVLEMLAANEAEGESGVIIVDSTRRGKRVPDALRRTVPCWVAVWNRILFAGEEKRGKREGWWGVQGLGLEKGELKLIEERVEGWVEGLKGLRLDFEGLRRKMRKPMRCVWVVNGEGGVDHGAEYDDDEGGHDSEIRRRFEGDDCYTLVLCSGSRRVLGAEMSEDGYIQGAGDDNESWSQGLTAELFWKHRDQLMSTAEDDLPELIERLVQDAKMSAQVSQGVLMKPTINLFLAPHDQRAEADLPLGFDAVISCNGSKDVQIKNVLQLGCRSGKLGSRDLRESLALVQPFATKVYKNNAASKVLVTCETGKDLSVGVMLVLLCMYFDDQGGLIMPEDSIQSIDKQFIKQRLAWITSCKPDANPSGSTLQSVNAFLMGRPP